MFRTIGEVADDLDLPAHVLRFWESKFPQLKPLKRGGGRRYYRPEDIALLSRIRQCLYQDGYTIRGVQKLLSDGALDVAGAPEIAPSLFPLEPASEATPPTAAKPPRAARRAPAPPAGAEPVEPRPLPEPSRAALEGAVQDLLSARHMLDALLHRSRKG
ncbi:MAG TPA: MerR family transcriptional regulator [Stellaceae bacterium]|nr:MerR family transcriptional regulator [Stellaceae bacterium]